MGKEKEIGHEPTRFLEHCRRGGRGGFVVDDRLD
jgi:hypothetical protein